MSYDFTVYKSGLCAHCGQHGDIVYESNLTYNLGPMLRLALPSWDAIQGREPRTEEPVPLAPYLAEIQAARDAMRAQPERFRALNPANGWGSFEGCQEFVDALCEYAERYPESHLSTR